MTTRPLTIRELDEQMEAAYASYCDAMDTGDLELADRWYAEMDTLLDQRAHHLAES